MNQIKEPIRIKQLNAVYESVFHEDFRALMNYSALHYKNGSAFIVKEKKGRKDFTYKYITFEDFRSEVNWLGTAMTQRNWVGKRIAIIGKNRYEWMQSYFAALCGIGVCIPLDKGLPYEELETSLARSYADILIFDPDHRADVEKLKENGKTRVAEYISMDALDGYISLKDLTAAGKEALEGGFTDYLRLPIDAKAATILLFTSGTTSMAKAVMLSQYNVTSNLYAVLKSEDVRETDVSMAFLPYHHTFGSIGQLAMISKGVTTTYCDGLKYLQKNIVEYKVSVFFCVPLLIESIYKKIMATVKKEGLEKKVAFGQKLCGFLLKFGIDIRRKVFKDVLAQLGGNLRFVISGAAAIDPVALEGFQSFGIDTVQGYGMTESSPILAAESKTQQRTGSIGLAIQGVDLRIDNPNEEGIGELIARGPNIMAGYFENQEETDKVLADGWLHTGDLAYLDKDGYVFICGRKKNVIVLKNGKNVYPEEIEILIAALPYVEENMVFGQPRHKDGDERDLALAAKIVYKADYMKENYDTEDPEKIQAVIKADIDRINAELPVYKQLLRVITTDEPMIKTTTGKVKRYEEAKNM